MKVTNAPRKLLRWFKRENVWARELNQYLMANPQTNRRVGSLPYEWIKDFEPSQRARVTQEICDVFERFAIETKDLCEDDFYTTRMTVKKILGLGPVFKELQSTLRRILQRKDVFVGYLGQGAVKMSSKIDVGGKGYAFSIFKDKGCRKGFKSYYTPGHGRGYEPQNIFMCYYKGAHGRNARPFMSLISNENDLGGFTLTKYIDYTHPKKGHKTPLQRSREYIFDGDSHNQIHGISIEAGGKSANENHIFDRHDREIWYRFANIISGYTQGMYFINGVGGVSTQKFLLQQSNLGIDICSKEFKSKLRENIIKYCIQEHKKGENLTGMQQAFLTVLEKTEFNSKGYKYLINEIGKHIKPSSVLSGHKNFGEQIDDILKRTNRKVHRQIRSIKKLRKLKSELEVSGNWESIKAYLNADFANLKERSHQHSMFYPTLLEKDLHIDLII